MFVNRAREFEELDKLCQKQGLIVVFGRRRVGKTRLVLQWLDQKDGFYTQAVKASAAVQIEQIYRDLREVFPINIEPKSWDELFALFDSIDREVIICIDEFPYLVDSDPSLPSFFQKYWDRRKNKVTLVLMGSSQKMMNSIFLSRDAPLYGRALKLLKIEPMTYGVFCEYNRWDTASKDSFIKYALTGGIPRYWEFSNQEDPVAFAHELFFDYTPYMQDEPLKLLGDENIGGIVVLSLLEAMGRGKSRLNEISSKLKTVQTNITRPMQLLTDMSIVTREMPFGESSRTTKKTLYKITDPSIRFWFNVYSPHRTRWRSYTDDYKRKLLSDHASTVFEDTCRGLYPDASRYWEKNEFDFVRGDSNSGGIVVSEVKFRHLKPGEEQTLIGELRSKFEKTKLFCKYDSVRYEVIDLSYLTKISDQ